jgi:CDP-diacylglycerol--glycerol-3-phosphate 3-phosphatidyltransferase
MAEVKLLNKSLVNGFYALIEPLAKILINFKVSPYIITFLGLFFSIFVFYFFKSGLFLPGGIFIILSGICDVLDGRLARDTNQISKFGALIDSVIDRYAEILFFLGLLVYFWEKSLTIVILLFLGICGSLLVSYTRARAEGLGLECKVGIMQRQERMTFLAGGAILGAIPYTSHFFLILSIWVIAVLSNFTVIQRILHIRRILRIKNQVKSS